jgi:hypothetical protein
LVRKSQDRSPERRCASKTSQEWIKTLVGAVVEFEEKQGLRKRKRRLADQRRFEEQIEALISDVTYTFLYAPKGRSGHICLSLSKQKIGPKQGGHRLVNSVLGDTLRLLSKDGIGILEVSKGSLTAGTQTIIKAARRLKTSIKQYGLQTDDFKVIKEHPLVQLRVRNPITKKQRPQKIDQSDPDVIRMTQELVEINNFLQTAWIEYHKLDDRVDEQNRRIYRVFNESLKRNGIAYGGFWMPLSKEQRLEYLYIDDEPCVEIDLKSAVLQIAYALVGQINDSDFYDIPSLTALGRDTVKKYTLMYLNGGKEAFSRSLPKRVYQLLCDDGDTSNDRALSKLITLIKEHHKKISYFFNPTKSGELTYILGDIIVSTVLRLAREGIVALPVTDAIYVKESVQDYAQRMLQQCFRNLTNNQNLRTATSL